jgi:hypothetical protein
LLSEAEFRSQETVEHCAGPLLAVARVLPPPKRIAGGSRARGRQARIVKNRVYPVNYYNESRIHRSLSKDAPFPRATERLGVITSQPVLGGLHHNIAESDFSVHTCSEGPTFISRTA